MPKPRPNKRARKAEDKQARRAQILAAAAAGFAEAAFEDLKMAEIARAAGVAKGTVFLYFPTKEALFMALLEAELDEWLAQLDAGLGRGGPWTRARVARLFVDTLGPRTTLTRLLALLASVLERNVDIEAIAAFKARLLARLAISGALLERRFDFLSPDDPERCGARLMLHIDAIVVGVHHCSNPGPAAREALERPELAPMRVDFESQLLTVLTAFLEGFDER